MKLPVLVALSLLGATLGNEAQSIASKCEKRYLKHYEVKGCSPEYEEGSDCPSKYFCPGKIENDPTVCLFKGKTYKDGDSIDIGNPCQICSCRQGFSGEGLEINCIFIECPQLFGPPMNDSCYRMYEDEKCCPVETKCSTDESAQISENVCEYDGRKYHFGERIYPKEDNCQICICNEQWNGVGGNSCRIHDCALELKRRQIQNGCIPIYHEATCCPIEFFCGTEAEGYKNVEVNFANQADIDSGNTCFFKGTYYNLGQTLNINHPTNCVTCTCVTPPDFTCVHKSCSGPPNGDYENCDSTYNEGECCPTYNCRQTSDPQVASAPVPVPQCSPVLCPQGCSEVTVHNSCPFCMCQQKLCSPPKCDLGCTIQTDVPEGQCPGCDCPGALPDIPLCSPVKCPDHCFEVSDPQGCPVCMCGPICSPPKCEAGCEVQRNVPEGECPKCECFGDFSSPGQLQCSPVKCHPGCTESIGESGCPSCVCKPLCSPPKCDAGCYLNPFPTGFCPECVCEEKESVLQLLCSPVKCGPLCHEAVGGDGCNTCICDPICTVPVCERNCHLDYNSNSGPCPVCACEKDETSCPSVTCGSMCEKQYGSDGCPTCSCEAMCSPPKCGSGCHLEYDRTAGPCPACVCPNQNIQCSPVKCDKSCMIAVGDNGCPTCVCNKQCAPVKCEPGCELIYSEESGSCPTCSCSIDFGIQCAIPKCDAGCQINYETRPCPSCSCDDFEKNTPFIECSPPKCDEPGCQIDYSSSPCPSCVCGDQNIPLIQCSPPKCDEPGCQIDYSAKPCPSCVCGKETIPLIQCSPPKCDEPGCQIDYSAKPCPSCVCGKETIPLIQCSPPKCDEPGCEIDYSAKPCPSCVCGDKNVPTIQCSPVKCDDPGCTINYSAKPCPSCECGSGAVRVRVRCSQPKCALGCNLDYSTKPCPRCACPAIATGTGRLQCSPLRCPAGCRTDYSAEPCPRCTCDSDAFDVSAIQCSPVKCDDPGCTINYSAKPCPSCECGSGFPDVLCSPPKCDPDCDVDYSFKPCPSCTCDNQRMPDVACSPPKCDPGCNIDYSTKPCPSCTCYNPNLPIIQCSPVKCDDPGCTINYSAKPCPSCECGIDMPIMCSPPKCENGCQISYSTKPCPSCVCSGEQILCSPVKCNPGCREVNGENGCPYCDCKPLCSMPKCGFGCRIDNNADPCPTCVCDRYLRRNAPLQYNPLAIHRDPFCARLKCGYDCEIDRQPAASEGCPMCICNGRVGEKIKCAAMQCELPCRFERFSPYGCPSCICHPIPCPEIHCGPTTVEEKLPEDRCPKCVPAAVKGS